MLKDRLRSSALLITVAGLLLWLDSRASTGGAAGWWLMPLLLFFGLGTAWDAATLLVQSGRMVSRAACMVGTSLVIAASAIPMFWPLFGEVYPPDCPVGKLGWIVIGGVAAISWILAGEMFWYGKGPSGAIERACGGVFVSLYVGMPMALMVAIRSLGEGTWGLAALVTMILVTKASDAGAYFSGRALGRHKLIPRLSPGKTREGAIGGILTSTIVAFAWLTWVFPALTVVTEAPPWYGALILGPVLAVSGMAGDLAESLVKRDCGAKDSGNWLPGLGGVWDVTDSLLAAAMPAFLCFVAGAAGK